MQTNSILRSGMSSIILFLGIIFSPLILQAQTPDYAWYGDGAATTFDIGTADELAGLAHLVNGTDGKTAADFSGKTIRLTDNIPLSDYGETYNSGKGWIPIGTSSTFTNTPFRGIFDGNGKKITGLYIHNDALNYVGLFGKVQDGALQKLSIENVNITGNRLVGGVAGMIEGSSGITNCYTTGNIKGSDNVGGIAGNVGSSGSSVVNCYSTSAINGNNYVGGIAGDVINGSIINCYSTGAVSGDNYVGGMAGLLGGSVANCAALNPSITRNSGISTNFGRIAGIVSGSLTGNVAFSDMTAEGGVSFSGTNTHDGLGGESKTIQELQTAIGFPEALTQAPWTYVAGKLPGLGEAVEMPAYLKVISGINTFGGAGRHGAVSFVIDNTVYVGSGYNDSGVLKDFWKYSKENDTWVKIADFGGDARTNAVAFTLNGKAYVGLGRNPDYTDNTNILFKDFYEYNPSTNQWTKCSNDFGGTARHSAVCFVIENRAYVGTGRDSDGEYKDFWSFDGTSWTQMSSNFSGDKRCMATAFVINNKAYVTGGFYYDSYFCQLSDVQEYNPATNTWTERLFADGINLSINEATAFTYNGKGYICYGNKNSVVTYDPVSGLVENLGDEFNFGGNRNYPISFVLNGIPYVGLGSDGFWTTTYHKDIVPLFEATSIKTPTVGTMHVYPNPVSESFRISGITENTLVTLSDISGKIVLQLTIAPEEAVCVVHLPKGVYIVRAADKTAKVVKR